MPPNYEQVVRGRSEEVMQFVNPIMDQLSNKQVEVQIDDGTTTEKQFKDVLDVLLSDEAERINGALEWNDDLMQLPAPTDTTLASNLAPTPPSVSCSSNELDDWLESIVGTPSEPSSVLPSSIDFLFNDLQPTLDPLLDT